MLYVPIQSNELADSLNEPIVSFLWFLDKTYHEILWLM